MTETDTNLSTTVPNEPNDWITISPPFGDSIVLFGDSIVLHADLVQGFYVEYWENVISKCEMDFYSYCAIQYTTNALIWRKLLTMYYFIIIAVLQFGGVLFVVYEIFVVYLDDQASGACHWNHWNWMEIVLKVIGFCLSTALALKVEDTVRDFENRGCYWFIKESKHTTIPVFINRRVLLTGHIVQSMVLIFVLFSCYVVIYVSATAFDMILNGLALFFILEMPTWIVSRKMYKDIETVASKNKYMCGDKMKWRVYRGLNRPYFVLKTWFFRIFLPLSYVLPFVIFVCH
eukprot:188441_1